MWFLWFEVCVPRIKQLKKTNLYFFFFVLFLTHWNFFSGSVRVVRSEGMPQYRNPFEKGDLYIKFEVQFPQNNWISPEKLAVWRVTHLSCTIWHFMAYRHLEKLLFFWVFIKFERNDIAESVNIQESEQLVYIWLKCFSSPQLLLDQCMLSSYFWRHVSIFERMSCTQEVLHSALQEKNHVLMFLGCIKRMKLAILNVIGQNKTPLLIKVEIQLEANKL